MPWKESTIEDLTEQFGVDALELREKQRLIDLIIATRKKAEISQTKLARILKVTQSRIAQIESGIGTSKITFDVLLHILIILGYNFKITLRKTLTYPHHVLHRQRIYSRT